MLSSACGLQSPHWLKCKVYACPSLAAQPHTGHFSLKLEEKPSRSMVKISLVGFQYFSPFWTDADQLGQVKVLALCKNVSSKEQ